MNTTTASSTPSYGGIDATSTAIANLTTSSSPSECEAGEKAHACLAFVSLMLIFGLVGNSLVLLVFNWRWRSTGATKIYVLMLALLDLLATILGMPREIITCSGSCILTVYCRLSIATSYHLDFTSAVILVVIATGRLAKVMDVTKDTRQEAFWVMLRNFKFRISKLCTMINTTKGAKCTCAVTFCLSVIVTWPVAFPPFVSNYDRIYTESNKCIGQLEPSFYYFHTVMFCLLAVFLAGLYLPVVHHLWQEQREQSRERRLSTKSARSASAIRSSNRPESGNSRKMKQASLESGNSRETKSASLDSRNSREIKSASLESGKSRKSNTTSLERGNSRYAARLAREIGDSQSLRSPALRRCREVSRRLSESDTVLMRCAGPSPVLDAPSRSASGGLLLPTGGSKTSDRMRKNLSLTTNLSGTGSTTFLSADSEDEAKPVSARGYFPPISYSAELTSSINLAIAARRDSEDCGFSRKPSTSSFQFTKIGNRAKQTTIVFLIITVMYILSYLPYFAVTLSNLTADPCESEFCQLLLRSHLISNAVNPLIYGLCNPYFRGTLWKILICRKEII